MADAVTTNTTTTETPATNVAAPGQEKNHGGTPDDHDLELSKLSPDELKKHLIAERQKNQGLSSKLHEVNQENKKRREKIIAIENQRQLEVQASLEKTGEYKTLYETLRDSTKDFDLLKKSHEERQGEILAEASSMEAKLTKAEAEALGVLPALAPDAKLRYLKLVIANRTPGTTAGSPPAGHVPPPSIPSGPSLPFAGKGTTVGNLIDGLRSLVSPRP